MNARKLGKENELYFHRRRLLSMGPPLPGIVGPRCVVLSIIHPKETEFYLSMIPSEENSCVKTMLYKGEQYGLYGCHFGATQHKQVGLFVSRHCLHASGAALRAHVSSDQ